MLALQKLLRRIVCQASTCDKNIRVCRTRTACESSPLLPQLHAQLSRLEMTIVVAAQLRIAHYNLLLLRLYQSLHVLDFLSCVLHELEQATILVNESLLVPFYLSVFIHDSIEDLLEFSCAIVLIMNNPW